MADWFNKLWCIHKMEYYGAIYLKKKAVQKNEKYLCEKKWVKNHN